MQEETLPTAEEVLKDKIDLNSQTLLSINENKVSIFYYIIFWVGIFIGFSTVVSFLVGDIDYVRGLILGLFSISLLGLSMRKFAKESQTTLLNVKQGFFKGSIFLLVSFLIFVGFFIISLLFFTF